MTFLKRQSHSNGEQISAVRGRCGEECEYRGTTPGGLGLMELTCILIMLMVTQTYMHIKIQTNIHQVNFITC